MCSEKTKHVWYKYYGLFVRMYLTCQQSYLSHINTRQKSIEAFFERHFKKLFAVIIIGELTNSLWHLC